MTITTITVNQWRIKANAEEGRADPVICLNTYEGRDETTGKWGPKTKPTEHTDVVTLTDVTVSVKYDPVNKTPCGASCWMEVVGDV